MRICVITFPFGTNYGGVLQCYAMKNELEKAGHSVTFLRYWGFPVSLPEQIKRTFLSSPSLKDFYKRTMGSLRHRFRHRNDSPQPEKQKLFDDFREKYLTFTPVLRPDTIGDYMNEHFDAIVVGSDQVWTDLASADRHCFIGWLPEFKGKRISYAACSAHKKVSKYTAKELRPLLERFDLVTVRDNTTATLVESITGKRPEIVPDPTILHDFSEFTGCERPHGKYILTYVLGTEISGGHAEALRRIKEKVGEDVKVVSIMTSDADRALIEASDETRFHVSPEEWVTLISGAEAVYTDSFHAMLFSMKYDIPFIGYYRDVVRSSRPLDLKARYSLAGIVGAAGEINELSRHHLPTESINDYLSDIL